jgi:hypothetical protein
MTLERYTPAVGSTMLARFLKKFSPGLHIQTGANVMYPHD